MTSTTDKTTGKAKPEGNTADHRVRDTHRRVEAQKTAVEDARDNLEAEREQARVERDSTD
jgi:hypothetical protein